MLTVSDDCSDPPSIKLAMPPASNSAHEKHGFQSHQRFKADFRAPKSIFEKYFKIILYFQIWLLVTFWMSQSDCGHICDPLEAFGDIWRKKIFRFFSTFFKQFLLDFGLKMKQKLRWKNRKCGFFKNEALNWKSASVKVLGYMLTVSDDCGDPPSMKLAMPPASNSALEKHGF